MMSVMLINGKEIAEDICSRVQKILSKTNTHLSLGVVMVGNDVVMEQFVRIKKRVAESVGVTLTEHRFSKEITTQELVRAVQDIITESNSIIVQLPLPQHIDFKKIQNVIPASHDVDCLGTQARNAFERGDSPLLPPVVGAIKEILERYSIEVAEKHVVVVGKGILVGEPVAVWMSQWGAHVVSLDDQDVVAEHTHKADIIVLGAGAPHFLKPDMVKNGVVILDAGTSESGGKVVGDADPTCADKASLMTPVPGGIGPIAVAMLFKNLLICSGTDV
ncbi:MAG: bifunctional 5,10-methylenetetrahydrofolate dehydrogenase/5,10-methenyltetrahydrofolate cyclohydrolase [Candidatus Campbellbacteria bacterium]|nr:bifunctional 5,10-methylenetetrahydrofolate dehydrogenase/5,10-methenyltetrahydrofolate cyclohydrolase [Candidatus Campbellbacteria bacterium]